LGADIANAWVAVGFRELGIGPEELRASHLGELVSIGRLSVNDAARTVLGPRAAGGLDQRGRRSAASIMPCLATDRRATRSVSSTDSFSSTHRSISICVMGPA
jgi:hypothetical protein